MTDGEIVNRLQRRISCAEERIESLEERNDRLKTILKTQLDIDPAELEVLPEGSASEQPEVGHDDEQGGPTADEEPDSESGGFRPSS
ncbi:hypothetical protein BRC64_04320 [Halobacteriales archaeon QH_10_67_22]|nr:MAG: hypothetical protein BRC64_04320 [Halobacteriales archaeon QH_10_67_22]